jgi:serine/threonine protein kinase
MPLSQARVVRCGETPYAHEQEGIRFAIDALPDRDPYHLWALVDLLDTSTGRLLEIDLLVLGYSCLYLVELKAWPGRIEGDSVDWTWITPEGRRLWRDNPRTLTRRKAQVLKSRLEAIMPAGVRAPWVEPLIFLSDKSVQVGLDPTGAIGVVQRAGFAGAITNHVFPGADPRLQGRPIDRPAQRAIVQALAAIGFRQRKGKLYVGPYELGALLTETSSYQDREATHRDIASQKRRARTYLVPEQTSVERRQQLRRAADREAQLLYEVREHPNILTYTEYVTDAPLGPTVLFDAFEGGIPVDAFLRAEPTLGFDERISIILAVGRALAYCHRKAVIHGDVSPASVLVRRSPSDGAIEVRLFNFQLGGSGSVEATSHRSVLGEEGSSIYQDPEVRRGVRAPDVQADMFSLGALAYLVITGKAPAATVREVDERLERSRCLDPRDVSDAVKSDVADLVEQATHVILAQRADHVESWIDLLYDHVTRPEISVEPDPSPLEARKGDRLGDLEVIDLLGHGASSRVLEVERPDGRRFALKVSLGPDHDARLRAEAGILASLVHPRIVRLEGDRVLGGRPCLLLSLAGRSLQRELAAQGSVSLDYASRYGSDLLGALEHLEEKDVLHRDIKPANLGVGAVQKKATSLTLFDFSLASAAPTDLGVGTAAYRDPYLADRGRWDFAADRWSAAVTLHELLTGQRPELTGGGDAPVRIAAERLDPSVRGSLTRFFQTAFARAVAARHASAVAMRRDWERAFEARPEVGEAPAPEPASDEVLAALAPDTPIQALPLGIRAKNALDRAGVLRAIDLLALPQNRLSAIRGVGLQVAREIHEFRERWTRLAKIEAGSGQPAFFPGYGGDDLPVEAVLSEATAEVLHDAGLRALVAVATAPAAHLAHLARRDGLDEAAVRAALASEHESAAARTRPTTLGAWLEALLPARKKRVQHARALFGLEGPLPGRLGTSARELAEALGITPAAVYIALGKAKDDWARHAALPALAAEVRAIVDQAGGAIPVARAGEELFARVPDAAELDPADARLRAVALVRIVAEVEKDEEAGLRLMRLDGDAPWLVRSEDIGHVVRALGKVADELAARDILAGPAEVDRALAELTAGTPLAGLPADRRVRLAAAASRHAVVSSRLELYPRAMEARRALELSAAVLTSPLGEDELRKRVAARYPDAAPLPPRPELDSLVAGYGLRYLGSIYVRAGDVMRTSHDTSLSSYTRVSTGPARPGAEISAREVAMAELENQVRTCMERNSLLVLGVSADRAPDAERALSARFGLVPRSFDALFLEELDRQVAKSRVRPALVYDTDAAGPASEGWSNLRRLAERTAEALASALLPPRAPLLLTQPGLIDRYGLVGFLRALVRAAERDEAEAIFLLVPGHEGGRPRIGETVIPDLLPGQSLWIPKAWIGAHAQQAA